MSDSSPPDAFPASPAKSGLTAAEWLFLAAFTFGWAVFVAVQGKDMAWDFRNYHWYIPYAFLNGRLGFDVAVAHQATYYNPLLDIPFYWLATHTHAWFALGVLGAVQGSNIVPIYVLARTMLRVEPQGPAAAVIALVSMTGSLTFYLAGTTYYDNVMSVLVLTGLALVIANRGLLRDGSLVKGAAVACVAGFLVGSATGLKLPEAPFALGFAAALAILPGGWKHRSARLAGGAVGGLLGIAVFAGYWMIKMDHLTGNPLFPYFNQYFHSPLALAASYRDLRFVPHGFVHQLLFPLLFSIDWAVADDLPFRDIRVGIAYVVAIVTLLLLLARRLGCAQEQVPPLVAPDAAFALIVFAAVAYFAWLKIFAIYRYILLLEFLAPLLIAAAVALWPVTARTRLTVAGILLLLAMGTMRAGMHAHAPATDPYIQAAIPTIARPDNTMILMTGEAPLGYLAPSLPPQIPIIRIDGWMIQPRDGSQLTAKTRRRVDAFHGDLYAIAGAYEMARNHDALADYGLAIDAPKCRNIVTNLGGLYRFCPLARTQSTTP